MYYVSRVAGVAALGALGIAMWFSVVLARADFYFRAGDVQRAVEIAPRNTEYLALRALQLDYDGADSRALTEKIAALNPEASAPRIRMGLAAEVSGDWADAERWLLEAASVDHQFEPRWTLANFYFRADRKDEFWKWMRAGLEVSYGDRTPAYDLCWRVRSDGGEILRRAIPDRHEVVGSYLVYVLEKKKDIVDVARRLAAFHEIADVPLLLGACDQLIEARDPGALEVWTLAGLAAPQGVFNGDFATAPVTHGFDWRAIESAGVTQVNQRIALSGQQSESCVLLRQMLSVAVGKRYRLSWESRTSGIKTPSGIEWRIGGGRAMLASSEDWAAGELAVTLPDTFSALELVYQRPVGESRAEGYIELRHVRLVAP
jgi:hypothetical protein